MQCGKVDTNGMETETVVLDANDWDTIVVVLKSEALQLDTSSRDTKQRASVRAIEGAEANRLMALALQIDVQRSAQSPVASRKA